MIQIEQQPSNQNIQKFTCVCGFSEDVQFNQGIVLHKKTCEKYLSALINCNRCKRGYCSTSEWDQLWFLNECLDMICKICLNQQVVSEYIQNDGLIKCSKEDCQAFISQIDIELCLGRQKYEELDMKLVLKSQNIVSCFQCKGQFSFENGKTSDVVKDKKGKQLQGDKLQNYVDNRFICPYAKCKVEQCLNCNAIPFHTGLTCDDFVRQSKARKCRFCDQAIHEQLDLEKPKSIQDVCKDKECLSRAYDICKKIHKCGHFCTGVNGENECLPCMEEECIQDKQILQNADDYCHICFTEALRSAPCVKSQCGHTFHQECVLKRLETRWLGARMVFNFLKCPLCQLFLEFSQDNIKLGHITEKYNNQFKELKEKVGKRLSYEGRDKDKELSDPKHPFYQKPIEYGLAIFAYYECFKCHKPYFGGLKNCQQNLEENRKNKFDPSELVCSNCMPASFDTNCKEHGKEYIEFKCRFCCTLSLWFCWGTTHFCDPCHDRADEMKNKNKSLLKVCNNADTCPLKINHKPNGEECALGCALCREQQQLGV